MTARVDGRAVELALTEHRYPPLDLLAAGGGTVTLQWAAALPPDARDLAFTSQYAPGAGTVQMSVLVAPDPVALGRIGHGDGGRTHHRAAERRRRTADRAGAAAGRPRAARPCSTPCAAR